MSKRNFYTLKNDKKSCQKVLTRILVIPYNNDKDICQILYDMT